jgi:hypothetical protein
LKLKELGRRIENLPRPAYIFLRAVLALCCLMLFACFVLFLLLEEHPESYRVYRCALLLLENPAGVLIVGGVCFALILDRC